MQIRQDDVQHSMTNQTKREVFKRSQLKIKDNTRFSFFGTDLSETALYLNSMHPKRLKSNTGKFCRPDD